MNLAFGAVPSFIVQKIEENPDSFIIKKRAVDDLEKVFDNLAKSHMQVELRMLSEHANSFINFLIVHLLEDKQEDLRMNLTAIKGIKLILIYGEKVIKKFNSRRLISILTLKLGDPKEVVRREIELVLADLSSFFSGKDIILILYTAFNNEAFKDIGKRQLLQIIMIILLKQAKKEGCYEEWGSEYVDNYDQLINNLEVNQGLNIPAFIKNIKENLYMTLIQPVYDIFISRYEKLQVRFMAQEYMVLMALGCPFLNKDQVLEAIYECSMVHDQSQEQYNRFCDRIECG